MVTKKMFTGSAWIDIFTLSYRFSKICPGNNSTGTGRVIDPGSVATGDQSVLRTRCFFTPWIRIREDFSRIPGLGSLIQRISFW
jgi:hypothetical protein